MNGNAKKSWWGRNWKWIVPVGCSGMVLFFCAFIFMIFAIVMGSIRTTDAFKEGVALATSNPEVLTALGEPVEAGWFVSGSVNVNGAGGEADLSVPLVGRQGRATLYIIADKRAGRWEFELLEVAVKGRDERIDLLDPTLDPES